MKSSSRQNALIFILLNKAKICLSAGLFLLLFELQSCGYKKSKIELSGSEIYSCNFDTLTRDANENMDKFIADASTNDNLKLTDSEGTYSIKQETRKIFKEIYYKYLGLDSSRVFVSASTGNYIARCDIQIQNNWFRKTLFYNPDSLYKYSHNNSRWVIRTVIAHEISHLISVDNFYRDKAKDNEIFADYFAGIHLARLGVKSSQLENIYRSIILSSRDTINYPTKQERIQLILKGYKAGVSNVPCEVLVSSTPGQLLSLNNFDQPINISELRRKYSNLDKIKVKVSTKNNNAVYKINLKPVILILNNGVKININSIDKLITNINGSFKEIGNVKESDLKYFSKMIKLDASPEAIVYIDHNNRIVEFSTNGLKEIGYVDSLHQQN